MSDKGYKGGEVNTAIAQAYAGSFVDTLGRRGDVMEKTAKETVGYMKHAGPWFCARCQFEVPYHIDWGVMSKAIEKHYADAHAESAADYETERAAHERTRAELGHSQQSKMRMFVWDGRGKYKVVSCANSVSEARALALEEMSLRGDLLNMREHIEHEQPLIYHRANAELALTESGETEELNICLEAETKRRQTAEAELESLRAENFKLKNQLSNKGEQNAI